MANPLQRTLIKRVTVTVGGRIDMNQTDPRLITLEELVEELLIKTPPLKPLMEEKVKPPLTAENVMQQKGEFS